jgi:hypothetical protein
MNYHFRNLLPIALFSFLLTFGACSTKSSTDNTNDKSVSSAPEEVKVEVDVCKCLTEAGDSNYMVMYGEKCDKAISREIGVNDWRKVNFKYNKEKSKQFDDLVYRCTGKRPEAEISGTYTGEDNVGMESTIVLKSSGTLIVDSSVGDGSLDYGRWTGSADNVYLYHKDQYGNEELIGRAEISKDGLQIKGGKFYNRQ